LAAGQDGGETKGKKQGAHRDPGEADRAAKSSAPVAAAQIGAVPRFHRPLRRLAWIACSPSVRNPLPHVESDHHQGWNRMLRMTTRWLSSFTILLMAAAGAARAAGVTPTIFAAGTV
jgi:hypothetical protein